MARDREREEGADSVEALAAAMPRRLIEEGRAETLARDWLAREAQAVAAGGPPFPCFPFDRQVSDALFEARRARRLVRGLEEAGAVLDRMAAGLAQTPATQPASRRIARLLVVSDDGSPRFYAEVGRLIARHRIRVAGILVSADEVALGEAAYGRGKRARALLVDHKEAVSMLLERLGADGSPDPAGVGTE